MLDVLILASDSPPPPAKVDALGILKVVWTIFTSDLRVTAILVVLLVIGILIPKSKKVRR